MSYTPPTLQNFNATPPSDDGSEVASNALQWQKHIDKIGDPLRVYAQAIDAAAQAAFLTTPDYSQTAIEAGLGVPISPTDAHYPSGDLRRYGMAVDGSTGLADAWAKADEVSDAGGPPIFVPKTANGCLTATPLTTRQLTDVVFEPGAFLIYTGSSNVTALTLGVVTGNTDRRTYKNLDVRRNDQSDWTSELNIGVRCLNLVSCNVEIQNVGGFTIGVQAEGNDYGNAHNHYSFPGQITNNKIGLLVLSAETSLTAGFCNENFFIGGRFTVFTGVNNTLDRWGIKLDSTRATPEEPNSNYFLKPSFEMLASDTSGVARPILVNYGLYNKFVHCRDEDNDQPFMQCDNTSENNFATTTISALSVVQNDGDFQTNFVDIERAGTVALDRPTWQSPALHRACNEYDGAGATYIPGMNQRNSTNTNEDMALTTLVVTDNYLEIPASRGVGVFLDTGNRKRFVIRKDVESGFGGRVVIVPYDTSHVHLTTDVGYVAGTSSSQFTHSTNVGGSYSTGADSDADIFFSLSSDVHFVWVGVFGGDAVCRIRSFQLQSLDGGALSVFQGFLDKNGDPFPNDYANYATADPATATAGPNYPAGKRLATFNVGTGGVPGRVCITQGLGGTAAWENEAALS